MNAKKTKIKPKISVVLKESPLLRVKKEESKEESKKEMKAIYNHKVDQMKQKLVEDGRKSADEYKRQIKF